MAFVPAALGIVLAVLFILKLGYVLATAAALPATRGAMFTSTHPLRVEAALEALRLSPGELLYDLGCGDGRFLSAACRRGARAVGFELNGWAYLLARLRTLCLPQARVRLASFWEEDLSGADCVVCYLFPDVMAELAAKLEAELCPGARVASCNFPLPGWRPERVIRLHHPTERDPIYLYRVRVQAMKGEKAAKAGSQRLPASAPPTDTESATHREAGRDRSRAMPWCRGAPPAALSWSLNRRPGNARPASAPPAAALKCHGPSSGARRVQGRSPCYFQPMTRLLAGEALLVLRRLKPASRIQAAISARL